MNQLLRASVLTCLVAACNSGVLHTVDGDGAGGAGQMVCIGDPDRGGVVCKPLGDFWDCSAMPNGLQKCARPGAVSPSGTAEWACTHDGTQVICTASGTTSAGGSADWACVTENGVTTCTSTTGADVPGAGSWTCTVDQEFGVTCEGTPAESGSGTAPSSSSGGAPGDDTTTTGTTGGNPGEEEEGKPGEEGGVPGEEGGSTSGAVPFPCSYAMVVFTYKGSTYVMKIPNNWTSCTFTNQTSSDALFEYSCNGDTYNNPDFVFNRNGSPVPTYGGPEACSDLFTVSGLELTASPGVTIIYSAAHNGSFEGHFQSLCPAASGTSHVTFPQACGG